MHNAAMRRPGLVVLLSSCLLAGCTHWETTQVFGDRREVGRRLVGSPQIEEVTSRSLSAGAAAGTSAYGSTSVAGAGVSGAQETVKRTHCVQQAQVDFVQDINFESHIEGRRKDVWTSVLIGGVGLLLGVAAYGKYHSDLDDCHKYGGCSTLPKEPTSAYAASGVAVLFAGGWLIYSFAALPKGAQPVPPPSQKMWSETTFVEATGCGLVPGDRPAPAPAPLAPPT
jgi:hypothetical protein